METRRFKISFRIAGTAIFLISVGHVLQNETVVKMAFADSMSLEMVQLFNWSVALLLLFMSLVCLAAGLTDTLSLQATKMLSLVLTVTWSCRLLLEFIYPVKFRFIIVEEPTTMLKIGIIMIIGVLVAPFAGSGKRFQDC